MRPPRRQSPGRHSPRSQSPGGLEGATQAGGLAGQPLGLLLELGPGLPQPALHLPPGPTLLPLGRGPVVAGKAPEAAEEGAIVGPALTGAIDQGFSRHAG